MKNLDEDSSEKGKRGEGAAGRHMLHRRAMGLRNQKWIWGWRKRDKSEITLTFYIWKNDGVANGNKGIAK